MYNVNYDIATNFDKEFIDHISKYENFSWVYGKLNTDIVGGGRQSTRLPLISWEELHSYVKYCHSKNIKFNYLLNALCLSGKEFEKDFHLELIELLDQIVKCEVDGVTVASPYICEIIKKQYPDLYISISVYNKVDSMRQLKYWKDIGAEEITLDQRVNRNFKKLEKLCNYAKELDLTLRIIANNTCLHECPFHGNHAVTHCHGSKSDEKSRVLHFDYQILNCNLIKIKDPSKIMSSGWIRPEDVKYYEELCNKIGYDKLSIKLTERGRTTEWLSRVATAYGERKYDGNLIDILNYVGKGNIYGKLNDNGIESTIAARKYNKKKVDNYRKSIFYDLPYINNCKLDKFITKFTNEYSCDDKMCSEDCNNESNCSYCKTWADKVITFDEESRLEAIKMAEQALDDVNSSSIFFEEEDI